MLKLLLEIDFKIQFCSRLVESEIFFEVALDANIVVVLVDVICYRDD
jgi:hypothetical protein